MKVRIRGYKGEMLELVFDDRIDLPEAELDQLLPRLAKQHADLLASAPHMIEIEFIEELDPLQRFFRFGTTSKGMMCPIEIDLSRWN